MCFKIPMIANGVFPKSLLPQLVFAASDFFNRHTFAQKMFGESRFYQAYGLRIGKIIMRQSRHGMPMIRQHDHCIDGIWQFYLHITHNLSQGINVIDQQSAPPITYTDREEKCAAGNAASAILNHVRRLPRSRVARPGYAAIFGVCACLIAVLVFVLNHIALQLLQNSSNPRIDGYFRHILLQIAHQA